MPRVPNLWGISVLAAIAMITVIGLSPSIAELLQLPALCHASDASQNKLLKSHVRLDKSNVYHEKCFAGHYRINS